MDNKKKQEVLKAAEELIKAQQKEEYSGHDYQHIKRVVKMALNIASKTDEKVDLFILELVCLLHDVDDHKIFYSGKHITVKSFLESQEIDEAVSSSIIDIISKLSFTSTKSGLYETTIEGKIAQDADRLDAIGAIGIARAFAYGGANKRLIVDGNLDSATRHHFDDKLFKLEELMNTKEGKKIAQTRMVFMKQFIKIFDEETKI